MIFDVQQPSVAGGIVVFPDWVYSALPLTVALEDTATIRGTLGGNVVSIGGQIGDQEN